MEEEQCNRSPGYFRHLLSHLKCQRTETTDGKTMVENGIPSLAFNLFDRYNGNSEGIDLTAHVYEHQGGIVCRS